MGTPLQQFDDQAGVVRGQMLGHHIGHPTLELELGKEHLERL
jgi:FAD synthase